MSVYLVFSAECLARKSPGRGVQKKDLSLGSAVSSLFAVFGYLLLFSARAIRHLVRATG